MNFSAEMLGKARAAQTEWRDAGLVHRLSCLGPVRHRIAERSRELALACGRDNVAESLSAEVLPLADACRFIEKQGKRWLAPRRERRGRPFWLGGVDLVVHRDPRGVVLVVCPGNYPLFLPGVQILQALAAGNAVIVKPAANGVETMVALASVLELSEGLLHVLDPDPYGATEAIRAGVDHVVLTGSAETGRAVLAETSPKLIPSTMELSGCDAAFVLEGADVSLAAKAIAYGLQLNRGCTCIAPRRLIVIRELAGAFQEELCARLENAPVVQAGEACDQPSREALGKVRDLLSEPGVKKLCGGLSDLGMQPTVLSGVSAAHPLARADIFAPLAFLFEVGSSDEALEMAAQSPYALGASVFGPARDAQDFSALLDAGVVVINDMIVPTADPRAPFGGRGESGFGVTRGGEGLLEMTVPKAVLARKGKFLPHLDGASAEDAPLFENYIAAVHGRGNGPRLAAWRRLFGSLRKKQRRDRGGNS